MTQIDVGVAPFAYSVWFCDVDLNLNQKVVQKLQCGASKLPEAYLCVNVLYPGRVPLFVPRATMVSGTI